MTAITILLLSFHVAQLDTDGLADSEQARAVALWDMVANYETVAEIIVWDRHNAMVAS